MFYTPLKRWFVQKDHKILYRGRGEHCLACGRCADSFVLSITFIRLAFLTGKPPASLLWGNVLFITLRISIHIFTRLRLCEKLDPHHPTSVLPLWKVFHCWAVRNHYKPEEQIPSYECLQLASRTRDDVWAVIGSLLPLVLRNTTPLWKEDAYCLNTSALKDQRVIKPWPSHCCEEIHGLCNPKQSNRELWIKEEQTPVRCCNSSSWPWPGLMDGIWLAEWPCGLGDCAHLPLLHCGCCVYRAWWGGVTWLCQQMPSTHSLHSYCCTSGCLTGPSCRPYLEGKMWVTACPHLTKVWGG